MSRSPEAGPAPGLALSPALRFGPALQHAVCILLVAAAIKMPLSVPLYLNALLLALGLFGVLIVQAVQTILLWPLVLMGLGAAWAAATGILSDAGPRLGQVVLIVFAISLLVRIDPRLFARYLILLVPISLLVLVAETFLPDTLYPPRKLFGFSIPRAAGLHGEHNYNAMMMGAVGVILAQHRPRVLALVPFMVALTAVSRGFLLALVAWCGAHLVRRWLVWLAPVAVLVLLAQPLIVLGIDARIDDLARVELREMTSSRFPIWSAYARMGLSAPLGVGYWEGAAAFSRFDTFFGPGYPGRDAHSIYLQVFGEFGWLGYLLFVGFILHVTLATAREAPAQLPLLLFILTGYLFYDGLSDWAFWIVIGYVLACVRLARETSSGQRATGPGR